MNEEEKADFKNIKLRISSFLIQNTIGSLQSAFIIKVHSILSFRICNPPYLSLCGDHLSTYVQQGSQQSFKGYPKAFRTFLKRFPSFLAFLCQIIETIRATLMLHTLMDTRTTDRIVL